MFNRKSYQQVDNRTTPSSPDRKISSSKSTPAEFISTKIHAAGWIIVASALIYFLEMIPVMLHDKRVARLYFNIGLVCFVINTVITLYLAIWLPRVMKNTLEWSVYCPRMIPVATALGVIGTFG